MSLPFRGTIFLLFLSAGSVTANDRSITGAGGSLEVATHGRTNVRMVKEFVRIDVFRSYYDVTADFEFLNDGPAERVMMGFPESGESFEGYKSIAGFDYFSSTVDGVRVNCDRSLVSVDREHDSYQAHWVKSVGFASQGRRWIRVHYRSKPGKSAMGDFVSYAFTGGNWKGSLSESNLMIVMHMGYKVNPEYLSKYGLVQKGNRLSRTWKNWSGDGTVNLFYR